VKIRIAKAAVVILAFVVAVALSPSALAQSFKKVNVQHKAKMAQIASGSASVWGLDTNGHPYMFKGSSFVQEGTISLAQIAVGGGSVRQPDTVWALDSAGNIYQVHKSGTTYLFNQIPGSLASIAVGIGYEDSCHPYEVWGLSPYVVGVNPGVGIWRFDFCKSNWDRIPGTLAGLVVGAGEVWGIDGNDSVFSYSPVRGIFFQLGAGLTQISIGPSGAWGVDASGVLYKFDPVAGKFEETDNVSIFKQVQAGGDGAWVITATDLRFLSPTFTIYDVYNLECASISAGSGGGVWAIDVTGQVYAFSTP